MRKLSQVVRIIAPGEGKSMNYIKIILHKLNREYNHIIDMTNRYKFAAVPRDMLQGTVAERLK
jgi:hypothetical protein